MKKKAFTMAETLIAMVMLGIFAACAFTNFRSVDAHGNVLVKMGSTVYMQIRIATTQILAKNSINYQMTALKTLSGTQFSITDSGADENLSALYKKYLLAKRKQTIPDDYKSLVITKTNITSGNDVKISDFTQEFITKSGTYVAFKLNGNCTTNETYMYDPTVPEKRTAARSCGLIFFDVNYRDKPNILGIDQYIISIGKMGLK